MSQCGCYNVAAISDRRYIKLQKQSQSYARHNYALVSQKPLCEQETTVRCNFPFSIFNFQFILLRHAVNITKGYKFCNISL